MLQTLIELDQKLFLFLNNGGISALDPIMVFFSSKWVWIPVYLFLFYHAIKKMGTKGLISIAFLIITITISDQSSVHLFKEVFQRLRPCHDTLLSDQVRLVADHCGGQYGFVSSHAANSFGLMMMGIALVKRKYFTLIIIAWAIIVSYSRIYLGVHYPGDILGGTLLGIFIGWLMILTHNFTLKKINQYAQTKKA